VSKGALFRKRIRAYYSNDRSNKDVPYRGDKPQGYTIVESLIFLAVTSAMFVMIMGTMSGRQQRAEFQYGIREVITQIEDIMNDVSTGNYNSPANYSCVLDGSGAPVVSSGAGTQGTNQYCIYVGRILRFSQLGGEQDTMTVYTMAGRRKTGGLNPSDVSTLRDSNPRPIREVSFIDKIRLPHGIEIKQVVRDGVPPLLPGAIGIFTDFSSGTVSSSVGSGPRGVTVSAISGTAIGQDNATVLDHISAPANYTDASGHAVTASVTICVESANGNQRAYINIGRTGSLSTNVTIQNGAC
jgi:hypothetical protein